MRSWPWGEPVLTTVILSAREAPQPAPGPRGRWRQPAGCAARMWALVSVSALVLTCAIDMACLGPMGGTKLPRHRIVVVLGMARVADRPH